MFLIPKNCRVSIQACVETLDEQLKQSPDDEARRTLLRGLLEEMSANPIEVALEEFVLSEREFYALRLAQMLPQHLAGFNNDLCTTASREVEILLFQARHLMSNGSLQPFSRFGNDHYIVHLLAVMQTVEADDLEDEQERLEDFLHRISDDACLHNTTAVKTLYLYPQYCFGFQFPSEFDLQLWKRDRSIYSLSVPFSRERVIVFVRDRFDPDFLASVA